LGLAEAARPEHPPLFSRFLAVSGVRKDQKEPITNRRYDLLNGRALCVRSRSRRITASVNWPGSRRQRQLPVMVPGVFRRASEPSPGRSCSGKITAPSRLCYRAEISSQWISWPGMPSRRRHSRRYASHCAGERLLDWPWSWDQPTTVSWRFWFGLLHICHRAGVITRTGHRLQTK
jgi:hypothetical protein